MKRLLAFLLATLMLATVLSGCKSKTPSADAPKADAETDAPAEAALTSVTFNIGQEPTTLDPGLCSGVDGVQVLVHMYEGLMKEVNHAFVCAAAEKYDISADGLVYTFHLRENSWSDGEPVRAQDFEFAWNRVLDEEVASQYSWIFQAGGIESFKALDDKTFEVTLNSQNPVFLTLLAAPTFMPLREDKIDYLNGAWALDPNRVITNGSYVMTGYTAGDRLILNKNEKFNGIEDVRIDELVGLMIADQTTALTGYESGQIDALLAVPPAEIPRLINEDPNFIIAPSNATNFYAFNIQKEPFDDVKVCKALTLAIDRTAIVKDVLKGGQQPAHSLIPGVVYDDQGRVFNEVTGDYGIAYDASKVPEAQQLLAEAGYPKGEGFPEVELLYSTSETSKAVAEAVQQMWKNNLGIDVKLVNMESAVFHQTRVSHDFDITKGGWNGDYPDPLTHLDLYVTDCPGNYAAWSNPEYDKLIAEGKIATGAERFEKFYAADKLLAESYAYMPISYDVSTALVNGDKVIGYELTSAGIINFLYAEVVA